jgi:hypothetical protein
MIWKNNINSFQFNATENNNNNNNNNNSLKEVLN